MESLLSIIVPVKNRAEIVGATLQSIANQTLRPLDVIVVDNGSTDGTLQVIEEWKAAVASDDFRVTLVSESKAGAATARNCGLALSHTPYTMFFDSDDLMDSHLAERIVDAFDDGDGPDIIGWDVVITDLQGARHRKPFTTSDALYHCIMDGTMATQRYAARTELFRRAGGWDDSIRGWDDIELGVRLLKLNPKMIHLDCKPPVNVIAQRESITGTDVHSSAERWEDALDRIDENLTDGQRRITRLRRAVLAGEYATEGHRNDARRLLKVALDTEPGWAHRAMLRLAYCWRSTGMRGIGRLLKPFFKSVDK